MPSPFAEAHPQLAALGFSVTPLIPGRAETRGAGKAPGIYRGSTWSGRPRWQELRDRPLSGFDLQLALQAPDAGCGVVLGTRAGEDEAGEPTFVIAIDVDAEGDAGDMIARALPPSPMRVRGARGFKAFYRAVKAISSRAFDDASAPAGQDRRLVDLLTGWATKQAVVAGIHPRTGQPFEWLAGPIAATELPIFSEMDLEALIETLEVCGYRADAPRQAAEPATTSAALIDETDPWRLANATALARLDDWVPAINLPGARRARGGWEAVPAWRPSSTARPMEKRARNLSFQTNGIRDFGASGSDGGLTAVDVVERALGISSSAALGWLQDRLGIEEPDMGVVIDFPALLANASPTEASAPLPAQHRARVRDLDLNAWRSSRFAGSPPEMQWLVRDAIPLAVPGMVAAQGDAGKSFALLDLARRIAFGVSPLAGPAFGGMVEREGTAVIITAEDDAPAIHRRLASIDPTNQRYSEKGERLIIVPLPDAGGPLALVREGREGLQATDDYHRLCDQLAGIPDLQLVVFDPLQAFVHAPINEDPAAGQFACSMMATLAARTQASVLLAHHMRKNDKRAPVNTLQDAREMVRGTSALVDGLRLVYAMWPEVEAEARRICERLRVPFEANRVIRGGVVKANGPVRRRISTYVRSECGLLVDETAALTEMPAEKQEQMAALAQTVAGAAVAGSPYTRTGASGLHENRHRLPPKLRSIGRDRLVKLADEAMERGLIVGCIAKGSTSAKWLDVPEGPLAAGVGEFSLGAASGQGAAA